MNKCTCGCGKFPHSLCTTKVCAKCCDDIKCIIHAHDNMRKLQHNIQKNLEQSKCSCGNTFSYECTIKACAKCCTDVNCTRHKKTYNTITMIMMTKII